MKSESVIPSIRYKKDDLFLDGLSLSLYGTYNSVNTFNVDTIARRYNWLGESVPSTSAGEGYYTDSKIKEPRMVRKRKHQLRDRRSPIIDTEPCGFCYAENHE